MSLKNIILLALLLSLIPAGTSYTSDSSFDSVLNSSVEVYYPFDDVNDSYSVIGTTGASGCQVDGCMDFDGTNDYIDLGDNDLLESLSQYSVSFWFNQDTLDQRKLMCSLLTLLTLEKN